VPHFRFVRVGAGACSEGLLPWMDTRVIERGYQTLPATPSQRKGVRLSNTPPTLDPAGAPHEWHWRRAYPAAPGRNATNVRLPGPSPEGPVARLGELRRLLGRREDSSDARPFHLLQERPRSTRQARDCANDAGLPHDTGHTGGGGRVGLG
jgi:hypothetical protein